jgi:eukaryotic-like serine/threonine-protein kinase
VSFSVADPFVIPEDVVLTSVRSLSPALRRELECEEDDCAITRPHSRTPSRVIDASTADLLRQFAEAKPITEAIIAFSRINGTNPEETLVEAFPALQRLVNDGLLVLASSSARKAIEPTFSVGDHIDGFAVVDVVQVLEDSEVYRGEAADGKLVAVKVARPEAAGLRRAFAREAAVLRSLDGSVTPRVMSDGRVDDRAYLAVEWLEGRDVSTTGQAFLARGETERTFDVARRLLDAYAAIHARGVLHGDVHPRNALVLADGSVRLIDFGLADSDHLAAELRPHERGGVGFFLEPELAHARLDGDRAPRLNAMGEQYSVAALVYLVLSSAHYLRFSPEKQAMRRQIVEETPVTFLDAGLAPSPAVEAVLRRALAKERAERFASMADFAAAFRAATRSNRRHRRQRARDSLVAGAETLTEALIAKAELDSAATFSAPTASVTYGAAGLAYGLLRVARAREDPGLLALADVWSQRAVARADSKGAFYSAELDITAETVGRSSPYHTRSGVHWVRACVSHAMADMVGFGEACHGVALASQDLSANPDLTLGRAGTLLAYSSLIDLGDSVPLADLSFVNEAGDSLATALAAELESMAPIAEERTLRFLGIAHGWAGIVYALLRWREATGHATGDHLATRLDELALSAQRSGDGLRWPRVRQDPGTRATDFVPSWCNGSAGFVHLWLTAERVLGDVGYRELAIGAARDALAPMESGIDLCCGLAGRSYALLALHRGSGDEYWLKEARNLTLRALRPRLTDSPLALSLYKGALGPAVLAAELPKPATASMPLFEAECW